MPNPHLPSFFFFEKRDTEKVQIQSVSHLVTQRTPGLGKKSTGSAREAVKAVRLARKAGSSGVASPLGSSAGGRGPWSADRRCETGGGG